MLGVENHAILITNHILIELPFIYSHRKACNFFPSCTLFVAWGTSEIARFSSGPGARYPIRSQAPP